MQQFNQDDQQLMEGDEYDRKQYFRQNLDKAQILEPLFQDDNLGSTVQRWDNEAIQFVDQFTTNVQLAKQQKEDFNQNDMLVVVKGILDQLTKKNEMIYTQSLQQLDTQKMNSISSYLQTKGQMSSDIKKTKYQFAKVLIPIAKWKEILPNTDLSGLKRSQDLEYQDNINELGNENKQAALKLIERKKRRRQKLMELVQNEQNLSKIEEFYKNPFLQKLNNIIEKNSDFVNNNIKHLSQYEVYKDQELIQALSTRDLYVSMNVNDGVNFLYQVYEKANLVKDISQIYHHYNDFISQEVIQMQDQLVSQLKERGKSILDSSLRNETLDKIQNTSFGQNKDFVQRKVGNNYALMTLKDQILSDNNFIPSVKQLQDKDLQELFYAQADNDRLNKYLLQNWVKPFEGIERPQFKKKYKADLSGFDVDNIEQYVRTFQGNAVMEPGFKKDFKEFFGKINDSNKQASLQVLVGNIMSYKGVSDMSVNEFLSNPDIDKPKKILQVMGDDGRLIQIKPEQIESYNKQLEEQQAKKYLEAQKIKSLGPEYISKLEQRFEQRIKGKQNKPEEVGEEIQVMQDDQQIALRDYTPELQQTIEHIKVLGQELNVYKQNLDGYYNFSSSQNEKNLQEIGNFVKNQTDQTQLKIEEQKQVQLQLLSQQTQIKQEVQNMINNNSQMFQNIANDLKMQINSVEQTQQMQKNLPRGDVGEERLKTEVQGVKNEIQGQQLQVQQTINEFKSQLLKFQNDVQQLQIGYQDIKEKTKKQGQKIKETKTVPPRQQQFEEEKETASARAQRQQNQNLQMQSNKEFLDKVPKILEDINTKNNEFLQKQQKLSAAQLSSIQNDMQAVTHNITNLTKSIKIPEASLDKSTKDVIQKLIVDQQKQMDKLGALVGDLSNFDAQKKDLKKFVQEESKTVLKAFKENSKEINSVFGDQSKAIKQLFESNIQDFQKQMDEQTQKNLNALQKRGDEEMAIIDDKQNIMNDVILSLTNSKYISKKDLIQTIGPQIQTVIQKTDKLLQENNKKLSDQSIQATQVNSIEQIKMNSLLNDAHKDVGKNLEIINLYYKNLYESFKVKENQNENIFFNQQEFESKLDFVNKTLESQSLLLSKFDNVGNIITDENVMVVRVDPKNKQVQDLQGLFDSIKVLKTSYDSMQQDFSKKGKIDEDSMKKYLVSYGQNMAKFANQFAQYDFEKDILFKQLTRENKTFFQSQIESAMLGGVGPKNQFTPQALKQIQDEFDLMTSDQLNTPIKINDQEARDILAEMKKRGLVEEGKTLTKEEIKTYMINNHFNASRQKQLANLFGQMVSIAPTFQNEEDALFRHTYYDKETGTIRTSNNPILNQDVFKIMTDSILTDDEATLFEKISKKVKPGKNALEAQGEDDNIEGQMKGILTAFLNTLSDKVMAKYGNLVEGNLKKAAQFIDRKDFVLMALAQNQNDIMARATAWKHFLIDYSTLGVQNMQTIRENTDEYLREFFDNQQSFLDDVNARAAERRQRFNEENERIRLEKLDRIKFNQQSIYNDNTPSAFKVAGQDAKKVSMTMYDYARSINNGPTFGYFKDVVANKRKRALDELFEMEKFQEVDSIRPTKEQMEYLMDVLSKTKNEGESVNQLMWMTQEFLAYMNVNAKKLQPIRTSHIQYFSNLMAVTQAMSFNAESSDKIDKNKFNAQLLELEIEQDQIMQQLLNESAQQYKDSVDFFNEMEVKDYKTSQQLQQSEAETEEKAKTLLGFQLEKMKLDNTNYLKSLEVQRPAAPAGGPPTAISGSFGAIPTTTGQYLAQLKGLGGGAFGSKGGFYQGVRNKGKVNQLAKGEGSTVATSAASGAPPTSQKQTATSSADNKNSEVLTGFSVEQKRLIREIYYDETEKELMKRDETSGVKSKLTRTEKDFLAQTYAKIFFKVFNNFLQLLGTAKKDQLKSDIGKIIGTGDQSAKILQQMIQKAMKDLKSGEVSEEDMNAIVDRIHKLSQGIDKNQRKEENAESKQMKAERRTEQQQNNQNDQQFQ